MQTQKVQVSCGESNLGKREGGRPVGWAPEVITGPGSQRTSQPTERSLILARPHYTLFFTQHQS